MTKQLLKDLDLQLVKKLLRFQIHSVRATPKKGDLEEFPTYEDVCLLGYESLTPKEIAIGIKHSLIEKYQKDVFNSRSRYWRVFTDKVDLLKDLKIFYKIKNFFDLLEENDD